MAFIQNLFTSRDNSANASTYVGQQGRIWWDPLTNSMYYSDGSTPGGIPVGAGGNPFNQVLNTNSNVTFSSVTVTGNINLGASSTITGNLNLSNTSVANLGNFTISDQTLAGTINNRTIRISPVGNAAVQVLNGIQVYQGNFSTSPLFSVTNSGVVSTIVPNAVSYLGAFEIVGNPAGNTVPPQNYGVLLHTTGVPSVPARIYNDGVANYAAIINRRYNGTSAAPTGVLANEIMGRIGATPYLNNATWTSLSTTRIDMITTEIQTTAAQGSKMEFYTVANGDTVPTLTMDLDTDTGITLHANVLPAHTNQFSLGNSTFKWNDLWLGPTSLHMEDTVTHLNTALTVQNGTLFIDGSQRIQIGNMQMTTDGISLVTANTGSNVQIGTAGDTGYMQLNMPGIKFRDSTIQTTAAVPLSYMGAANGVATLGADSKVIPSQLPAGAVFFKGIWDASTNTPTLVNGTGTAGWEYQCSVAGTVNFGAGNITFAVGDFVIYNGSLWQKIAGSGAGVTSFNTRTGVVTLTSSDVTTALSNSSIVNSKLVNPNVTITTGAGLSGGGVLALGGSLALVANVGNVVGGTGVNVAAASGNYTVSIGQPVGTANSVQFYALTTTTTVAATGNITGGNLTTGGKVVATGNIETSGNLVTPNTVINSSMTSNGNVNFTGANVSLGAVGNVRVTGGTNGQFLTTNGSGTLSWSNVAGANVSGTVANATYATSAGIATSANAVAGANVSGTVANATYATSAGIATSANAVAGANVSGTVTTATNLSAASSILAGSFSLAVNVGKNSLTTLTQTISGLTTSHKVIITPATAMPDNSAGFEAAWASSSNTLSLQFSNPGGAVNASFNINYFAWV